MKKQAKEAETRIAADGTTEIILTPVNEVIVMVMWWSCGDGDLVLINTSVNLILGKETWRWDIEVRKSFEETPGPWRWTLGRLLLVDYHDILVTVDILIIFGLLRT